MFRYGVGIDIEQIARFRKLDRRARRGFLRSVFTDREMQYCFSKKEPASHLAARFCAKEAVIKALAGMGVHELAYRSIEIAKSPKGVPSVVLHTKHRGLTIAVSLSHAREYAAAFALAMRSHEHS